MREFPTDYASIVRRLESIDPVAYARTRNSLSGAVTGLSPYLTHGVIGTRDVGKVAIRKAGKEGAAVLLKELAWRDFFREAWESLGDAIFEDLRYPQPHAEHADTPAAVESASTGILALDRAISGLVETGYMHNHARLWVAMLACNVARTAWWNPSRWMYYHLLDGDLASNSLSWQWVAGSLRKEPYVANQENVNRFSETVQRGTYLDVPYERLLDRVPEALIERAPTVPTTALERTAVPELSGEVLLYHPWSLDPVWQEGRRLPRVLLVEPDHFSRFPVSKKRLDFILALAGNVPDCAVVVADFGELAQASPAATFRFVEHPAVAHWEGRGERREPLFAVGRTIGRNWSFSRFWNKCSSTL